MPMRLWSGPCVQVYLTVRLSWPTYSNMLHGFHQLTTSMCFCQHISTGMLPLKALPHLTFPRVFMQLPAFTTNHDLSIIMKAGWIIPCWMIICWPHIWPNMSHYTLIHLFIPLSPVWAGSECFTTRVYAFSIFLKVLMVLVIICQWPILVDKFRS